ncbi:uroporphyrinogen-III C-methyltransferase [Massilia sp. TSP1-1-2]|uniref:uroporphyrinogen-III C-methyltransferase n=1 Tax=Massilia sp. TSP1-1-2 TaxID=2804649 RepID=UPI003CE71224
MNDLPTLPHSDAERGADHAAGLAAAAPSLSAPAASAAPAPPGQVGLTVSQILQSPLKMTVIVLAILLAALAWSTQSKFQRLRLDMAKSLQKGEVANAETAATVRSVQELAKDLQAKVTLLENRQVEAQSQQLALEQLYQDLSKSRDDWALAEIEQVLSTASQQLQLAGNVQGALIALQNADRSLARSDKPQFITIRRAIAKDTDKLKALPSLDLIGVALRIDTVIAQVDTLPMLSDAKPALPAPAVKPKKFDKQGKEIAPAVAAAPTDTYFGRAQATWQAWTHEMWTEMRQLIRVRKVDHPEALMVSPEQAYFLRENLKLRLLNARLALMSRNEAAFRTDMAAAQDALTRYFDMRAAAPQSAQAMLRQAEANNVAIDMPSLADSLNAVRNYKSKP